MDQKMAGSHGLSRLETRDGAYELKFVLQPSQVEAIAAWARAHLTADVHANGDETYRVHSVYLDTPDLSVYRRHPGFLTSKYRLRRYGSEPAVYLEEKRKHDGWVTKVRTRIAEAELPLLQTPDVPPEWGGAWFRQAVEDLKLAPCCHVTYRRLAREGHLDGAPVRLTLDRELSCAPAKDLRAGGSPALVPLELTILELKYRHDLPALFEDLIRTFELSEASASKYRQAAEACALDLL